ncbi:MAG: hypothetical protein WCI17_10555, partial [bacterium]
MPLRIIRKLASRLLGKSSTPAPADRKSASDHPRRPAQGHGAATAPARGDRRPERPQAPRDAARPAPRREPAATSSSVSPSDRAERPAPRRDDRRPDRPDRPDRRDAPRRDDRRDDRR